MTLASAVPVDELVELAHGAVAHALDSAAVRHVFIKGPGVSAQFGTPRRVSTDVDVWVDPARLRDALETLRDAGWEWPTGLEMASLASHAHVLQSKTFGLTVDVHSTFPGIALEDQSAFEEVWRQRTHLQMAGLTAWWPSRPMHALILLLHALREPEGGQTESLARAVRGLLTGEERQELRRLRDHLRAGGALAARPGLGEGDGIAPDPVWLLRTGERSGTALWILAIARESSLRGRVRLLRSALTPRAVGYDDWTAGQRMQALPAHLAKGLRQLPSAIRQLRGR